MIAYPELGRAWGLGMQTKKWRGLLLVLSVVLVPGSIYALPLDEGLTLQPIDVCDTFGANCAVDPTDAAYFANLQTGLSQAWAQAGIAPVLLPVETLNIGTVTTAAGRYGLITDVGLGAPIDGFRLLTRTPGNGQSPNPTTLNLYLVDSLVTPGQTVRGVSFVNGNGIIISQDSVFDTAFHETGHNLALDHTTFGAGDPDNLLTTGGVREIPTSVADVTPNGADLDQLTQAQIDRARQPLFTVNLGRATSTPFGDGELCEQVATCFDISFASNPSTTETLNSVQFRYGPGAQVDGFRLIDASGLPANDVSASFQTLSGGTLQLTVSFAPGAFGAGDFIDFATTGPDTPPDPISVLFNFVDGFSSQAGFDAVNGADSGFGTFGFSGTPTYGIGVTDPAANCPIVADPSSSACIERVEIDAAIPEPSALATLSAALIGMLVICRPRLLGFAAVGSEWS